MRKGTEKPILENVCDLTSGKKRYIMKKTGELFLPQNRIYEQKKGKTTMVNGIISVLIFALGLLIIGLGVWKNRKNHWVYAVARVVEVLASVGLGILISNLLGGFLGSALWSSIGEDILEDSELLEMVPSLEEAFVGLFASVFSLLLFVGVFFALKAIFAAVAKPVARKIILANARKLKAEDCVDYSPEEAKLSKKNKKLYNMRLLRLYRPSLYGMIGGGLMALMIWVAAFAPFVGATSLLNDGMRLTGAAVGSEAEILDDLANNAGNKTVSFLGGKPISGALLTCTVDGHSVNLADEVGFLGQMMGALNDLSEKTMDEKAAAAEIRSAADRFEKTDLLPIILPEMGRAASDQWDRGEDFLGMEKPSEGEGGSVFAPVLDIMADATYDTAKEDLGTILSLIADAVESGAWNQVEENPVGLFKDTEFSSSALSTLLKNERLDRMVGDFMRIGIDSVGDEFGANREYLNRIKPNSDGVTDADGESRAMAAALCSMAEMSDQGEFDAADSVRSLGGVLDLLKVTETVGPQNAEHLVMALICSENFMNSMGMNEEEATEVAESIIEGSEKQSYKQIMASMSDTIRVLEASNSSESVNDNVKVLMKSLDTTSAKVLSTMSKPGTMIANGVPEKNAESSANMMSSMFMNLSVMGEGMTREEFEAEADAVSNVTNLAMNASHNNSGPVFGVDGAMGVSARDFVNQTLDSSVTSTTIRDSVYEEGHAPAMDPLGTEMVLSAEEEAEILLTMNERWANEANRDDETVRRNYIALGSVINMEIVITAGGIQNVQ